MRPDLSRGRVGVIALSILVLAAGCARVTTAMPAGSGAVATTTAQIDGGPSSTRAAAPPETTARSPRTRTTAPDSSRSDPSDAPAGRRPAPTAKPVFTVSTVPTFYCETTNTLAPAVVAYDDGTVLTADTLGAYCDRVPKVRVGEMERAELDRLATAFFDSPDAAVNLSTLPVTDMPNTTVTFRSIDGTTGSVRIYGLGAEKFLDAGSIPAEQQQARKKLAELIEAVTAPATSGSRWVPDRLLVVGGMADGPGGRNAGAAEPVRRWPIPLTAAVRAAIQAGGNHRSCALIDDPRQAAAVLRAHGDRPTAARWTVEGREHLLAIGIPLPGFSAC